MIVRWVCKKDNKKWLYPVEKCIYCKGPITKQIGKKIKVTGITKVNIPSPMHPITPYNVLLLEDEYGNRMPKKTMRDYNIGDDYLIEKAKTDGAVVITKIKYDLREALIESLGLLKSTDVKENDKILVKPSIIEPAYGYQAVTTNPKLVDEIISYLKDKRIRDIIVAEQSMPKENTVDAAEKCGILDVCEKHNVPFIDLGKTDYVKKSFNGFDFKIAKPALDRKVINVPVMKTNSQIGISGAVENMVRVVDEDTQKRMFADDIENKMPLLIKALPKFLSVGDATIGMHGQGPTILGEPAFLNMIFLSNDPVALDTVFTEVGMLVKPNYIKNAAEVGAGNDNIQNIEIVGEDIRALRFHLKPADRNVSAHPNIKFIDGKANPYIFNSALKITARLVGILGEEINLAIGTLLTEEMVKGKKRLVAYGNEAIVALKNLGIKPLAEIQEGTDNLEKVMLLKSILENPDKKKVTVGDKIKSKVAKFGVKIDK